MSGIDTSLANAFEAEADAQRDITDAFLASIPTTIVLTPRTKARTASGGWTMVAGMPRPAQRMRIVDTDSAIGGWRPTVAMDGVERKYDYLLVAKHDAVVAIGDTFTYEGNACEVVAMLPPLPYEVRALAVRRGD